MPTDGIVITQFDRLDAVATGRDVFVLVNNKAEGSAPLTVLALSEMLAKAL